MRRIRTVRALAAARSNFSDDPLFAVDLIASNGTEYARAIRRRTILNVKVRMILLVPGWID